MYKEYDNHIVLLTEDEVSEHDGSKLLQGWYFATEAEDLEGPFESKDEAERCRDIYFDGL